MTATDGHSEDRDGQMTATPEIHFGTIRGVSHFIPLIDKLRAKTISVDGCWVWTGPIRRGYGLICSRGKTYTVHRVGWEQLRGPIPRGMVVDHVCRNKACWNPDHLRVVTQHENVLAGVGWAGVHARRTRCPRGHEYPPFVPGGRRRCGPCHRDERSRYASRSAVSA